LPGPDLWLDCVLVMYVDFLTLIIPLLLIVTVVLQVIATKRVHRDISFEPAQRRAQLWLIWLVPVFGAALVLSVMHEEPDTRRLPDRQSESSRS